MTCSDCDGTVSSQTCCQLKKNQIHGNLAQLYSQQDFIDNGFSIIFAGDRGFDFIATSPTIRYLVEVKFGNARLSRLQKAVQRWCKRWCFNYFVYRVTQKQLEFFVSHHPDTLNFPTTYDGGYV